MLNSFLPSPSPTENHDVYEVMWKYMAEPDMPLMAIWRRRTSCWIIIDTDTHGEYVVRIATPLQQ